MRTLLIAVEMLAGSVWVGSLLCLALVSGAARRTLDVSSRVDLFRDIGRLYGIVGTGALLLAIAAGVALAGRPSQWGEIVTVSIVLSVVLVALTVVGMAQARRMTLYRRRAIQAPQDVSVATAIRRGAAQASLLRASIAGLTLVIVVLGAYAIAE